MPDLANVDETLTPPSPVKAPTRLSSTIFRAKTILLQTRGLLLNASGGAVRRGDLADRMTSKPVIAESISKLWTETNPEERRLVTGKVQNLRVAVAAINGLEFGEGETFSFWANVGRTSRRRGFVVGRELRQGCLVPNVGGGLCQLSNALYDAALKANFEILERHAHTKVVAGSLAEQDRDATVFWNYVDLRFRSPDGFRIEATLTHDHVVVRLRGDSMKRSQLQPLTGRNMAAAEIGSCMTCGVESCSRVTKPVESQPERVAFLVDELVPEFDEFIQGLKETRGQLFVPIDGKFYRRANYAWSTDGFADVSQSPFLTATRSYRSRKLAAQGAARQRDLLATSKKLADSYAGRLDFQAVHVVVQQHLLPFLWRSGHLGGRTFDVLMTALPMSDIQARLDAGSRMHPDSSTLADFRADNSLIEAESEALAAARKIVTSHTAVAALFGDRSELIPWHLPNVQSRRSPRVGEKQVVVFPSSTVGRKGCYELRDALRGLDVRLLTIGPYIEGDDFWAGIDTGRAGDDWLIRASVVVLPALVEHRPRRLLQSAAAGVPVIATEACGVSNVAGIRVVPDGDVDALQHLLIKTLAELQVQ